MGILQGLKDFFLPSEEVSAQRRKDVFGTENKTVARTAIIAGAGLAIGAPALVASSAVRGAVVGAVSKIGQTGINIAKTYPKTTAVASLVVAPTILRSKTGVEKIKSAVSKIPSEREKLIQTGANVIDNPSFETAKEFVKENPLITGTALLGAGLVGGKYVFPAVSALGTSRQIDAIQEQTDAIRDATKQATKEAVKDNLLSEKVKDSTLTSTGVIAPMNTNPLTNAPQTSPVLTTNANRSVMKKPSSRKRRLRAYNQTQTNRVNIYLDDRQKIYI